MYDWLGNKLQVLNHISLNISKNAGKNLKFKKTVNSSFLLPHPLLPSPTGRGRDGVRVRKQTAYNNGVVNGPLHGPSRSGCLLFAQRKNKIAILEGAIALAATAAKFDVIVAVCKPKLAFEE